MPRDGREARAPGGGWGSGHRLLLLAPPPLPCPERMRAQGPEVQEALCVRAKDPGPRTAPGSRASLDPPSVPWLGRPGTHGVCPRQCSVMPLAEPLPDATPALRSSGRPSPSLPVDGGGQTSLSCKRGQRAELETVLVSHTCRPRPTRSRAPEEPDSQKRKVDAPAGAGAGGGGE